MYKLRFYGLLVGFSIMVMLSCDTLAFKIVRIFSYDVAASGLIYSVNFALSAIITEVYGFNLAARIIWVQLVCHIFFILLINLFVILPSQENSVTYLLYFNLYHNIWHVLLGSCVAMPIAYFINDIIVSKLKINLYGKKFIFRFLISSIVSSAILVSISYPINFYGQLSLQYITKVAFYTWMYKIIAATILFPFAIFLTNLLKNAEQTDYYDYGISYNPLVVFSIEEAGENRYEKEQKHLKDNSTYRYSSLER